ncbi:MAG TPA: DNA gyrase subunit B, partial [Acidiferrobacteraceae bacterium]|nr:DNA gyrase subunit B [Acidiferrobacteraceae bacterium]
PLYKIKQGKRERYLKDELELTAHLVDTALEQASLFRGFPDSAPLTAQELGSLCRGYLEVNRDLERLRRRYDPKLLRSLVALPPLSLEELQNEQRLQAYAEGLRGALATAPQPGVRYHVKPEADKGRVLVEREEHGGLQVSRLDAEFVGSTEYGRLRQLGTQLQGLLGPGARIQRGERHHDVTRFEEALEWLLAEARRGQTIQRYKGLGEMNPEQLWETTMDPAVRRLLKVNIEDGVAADQMFTTLMGDQVEPRRAFIERNALAVSNLDV